VIRVRVTEQGLETDSFQFSSPRSERGYVYNEASPQTDELRTVCEKSAHLFIF